MSASDRVALAIKLSETVFELTRGGIAARHPEYDDARVHLAFLRALHGDRVVAAMFPAEPLVAA